MQIQGLIWRGHCESKYWHQEKNQRDKLNLKSWSQLKTSVTGWISQQILALMEMDDFLTKVSFILLTPKTLSCKRGNKQLALTAPYYDQGTIANRICSLLQMECLWRNTMPCCAEKNDTLVSPTFWFSPITPWWQRAICMIIPTGAQLQIGTYNSWKAFSLNPTRRMLAVAKLGGEKGGLRLVDLIPTVTWI